MLSKNDKRIIKSLAGSVFDDLWDQLKHSDFPETREATLELLKAVRREASRQIKEMSR